MHYSFFSWGPSIVDGNKVINIILILIFEQLSLFISSFSPLAGYDGRNPIQNLRTEARRHGASILTEAFVDLK